MTSVGRSRKQTIEGHSQLLVEGADEERLFNALAKYCKIQGIQIQQYGGKTNMKSFMKTLAGLDGFSQIETLAIVGDADTNSESAKERIQNVLRSVNFPVPNKNLKLKSSDDQSLNACFLVIPHESATGMLEDVCLSSVGDDPALACVHEYLSCIESSEITMPKNLTKARVHAFLASRKTPGLRLGEAAEASIWNFNSDAFRPLKQLLSLLEDPL